MGISKDQIETAFKEMGLNYVMNEETFVAFTQGRYAPDINTVVTLDEDCAGLTIMAVLDVHIEEKDRAAVYELFNYVHGQSLWNVRFHMDEEGRVFSVGKVQTWGLPFNTVQFGDIYFSLVVAADRFYPCLEAIQLDGADGTAAFEKFFLKSKG